MNDKIFGYVGLAKRAGKLSDGTDAVLGSVRAGKSKLVILSNNASAATAKKISDKCSYYNVRLLTYGEMETLGKAVGREFAACVSVNDENFANAIVRLMKGMII